MRLIIGNKNYSSWSLRPWILLQHAGVEFDEVRVPLFTTEGQRLLEELCPAKQVPVLYDGPLVLWDSFAICEYIADRAPNTGLWPESAIDRALARAMCAEMHSSFKALRDAMPMNCRRVVEGFKPDLDTEIDINRLVQLLEQALGKADGPWLFGHYTVTDAMFTPIASRFRTYQISAPINTQTWMDEVLNDTHMLDWYNSAAAEPEVIEQAEIYPDKA